MAIKKGDVNYVKKILWPDENVVLTARQRRIGPGGSMITPTSVIATNRRIIIVNKTAMGIRKDIESIPYKNVTSVRWEHGIITSSVFLRVQGFDTDKGFLKKGREEGEIDGLSNGQARDLSSYVQKMISGDGGNGGESATQDGGNGDNGSFCRKCGAPLPKGSNFCPKCGAKT